MFDTLKDKLQPKITTELEANYRAQKIWDQLTDKNLSATDIYHLQRSFGYDVASSLLYKTFKNSTEFQKLNQFVEAQKVFYKKEHKDVLVVVLVHNPWESRKKNENYQWRLKNLALDAGFDVAFPDIQYRRSIYPNAYYYQDLFKRWSGRQVIFITQGLASLELRLLLERSQNLDLNVLGWLNISGMLFGTSLPPTNRDLFFSIKKYFQDEYPVLPEVGRQQSYCYGPVKSKCPLTLVNMLAVRPQRYYRVFESQREQELNYWGPHDGYVTLSDYLEKPGATWPLWGQGHYIDVEMFKRRLQATLAYFLSESKITF